MAFKKNKFKREVGFIQITLIIVGALVLLKYAYDIDIVGFLTTGKFREYLDKFYFLGSKGWHNYNETLINTWNMIVNFVKNLLSKKSGESIEI
jgi:hypothetical protein